MTFRDATERAFQRANTNGLSVAAAVDDVSRQHKGLFDNAVLPGFNAIAAKGSVMPGPPRSPNRSSRSLPTADAKP